MQILQGILRIPGLQPRTLGFLWVVCGLLWSGCYTFRGISIDPDVKTFFIQPFEIQASNAPPNVGFDFVEQLKQKIRTETRLTLKNSEPDVEFTGKVTDFRVVPVAPKPGELVSLNRLEVAIRINYINNKNEKKSWTAERDFRHFAEFNNDKDLLTIQNQLLSETIYPQLLEDIFNSAFNDW